MNKEEKKKPIKFIVGVDIDDEYPELELIWRKKGKCQDDEAIEIKSDIDGLLVRSKGLSSTESVEPKEYKISLEDIIIQIKKEKQSLEIDNQLHMDRIKELEMQMNELKQ